MIKKLKHAPSLEVSKFYLFIFSEGGTGVQLKIEFAPVSSADSPVGIFYRGSKTKK